MGIEQICRIELDLTNTIPEFNNSAGRLLMLLRMYQSKESHFDAIANNYKREKKIEKFNESEFKGRAYINFMSIAGRALEEFLDDVETSDKIPDASRTAILDGISRILSIVYPIQPGSPPAQLGDAEIALIRMAGAMLESEPDLEDSDISAIRKSIEDLRETLEQSDMSKSARIAMLELCQLSRNAIEQFSIHGARGFKRAFKRMLSELMETYLDEGDEVTKTSWFKSAVSHVKIFDVVVAKLTKYRPLLEHIPTMFLSDD